MANNLDQMSDDISYDDMKRTQTNPNNLELNVIAGSFYLSMRKMVKEHFNKVYNDLLERISDDYGIDLEELKSTYPLDIKVHKKRPRDPATACLASKKDGTQCCNSRKDGHDYCGVHLRSSNAPGSSYMDRGKITRIDQTSRNPSEDKNIDDEDETRALENTDNENNSKSAPKLSRKSPGKSGLNFKPTYNPKEESNKDKKLRAKQEKEVSDMIKNGGSYAPKLVNNTEIENETNTEIDNKTNTETDNKTNGEIDNESNYKESDVDNNSNLEPGTEQVDAEIVFIDGENYILFSDKVFAIPDNGLDDIESGNVEVEDLKQIGVKINDNGDEKDYKLFK
tara:strand:- start:934 stop:1947 length:1014 start_codon:yes stop_codon:yes gene_type:complete